MPSSVIKNKVAHFLQHLLLAVACLCAAILLTKSPAGAVSGDTMINMSVTGSTAPSLVIAKTTSISTAMPVIIAGKVDNLTQIRVFIDGIFVATIPLGASDMEFSYALNVSVGLHTVKFVGISKYTSDNPEIEIKVNYRLPDQPSGVSTDTTAKRPTDSSNQASGGGVSIGGQGSGGSPDKPQKPMYQLPTWLVQILVPLDVINPARIDETPKTLWRLVVLSAGLFLLVFTPLALTTYRRLRRTALGLNQRLAPIFLRRRPQFWTRVIGIGLLILVFLLT